MINTTPASNHNILSLVNGHSVSNHSPHPDSKDETPLNIDKTLTKSSKTKPSSGKFKKKYIVLIIIAVILALLGLATVATVFPLLAIKAQTTTLETSAREVYDALKHQNIVLAKQKLTETKSHLDQINTSYKRLAWYKITPFFLYYNDGQHALTAATNGLEAAEILVSSIEPYADVIGFSGEGTFTGGTAEERIIKILQTIDKIVPSLDNVASKLQVVDSEIKQINPTRYPFTVKGYKINELLDKAQLAANTAVVAVTQVKPVFEVLPDVAGLNQEKKYLVLFQNDAELRPTGGFLTAYSVLRVDKGRVYPENNNDIYKLDAKFTKKITPPDALKKHLNVFYWYLRDMNWSPDYKESMDTFLKYYNDIPGEAKTLHGVISVDTQVLVDLVSILGPVEVPGFGTFTSETDPRCNCPAVLYKLEDMASKPVAHVRQDRKDFLGPMMQTLLLKAYGSDKSVWPKLFEMMISDVMNKHVQFYMFDQKSQQAAEQVNIAGRVRSFDGDYFMVVDANLGGAKQNMFITEEIEDQVTTSDTNTTHQFTLTYINPAPWSNCNLEAGQLCLNGKYIDYVRIYLPKGSKLVEALGFDENSVNTFEEMGKTVIEGVFKLDPESRAKLKLTIETPVGAKGEYKYLIQKQAGKKSPKYTVTVNGEDQQQFELATDKELKFQL